jgi:predicted acetyltransferase
VVSTAMLSSPPSDEDVERRRRTIDVPRCLGAFDQEGRMRGAARSFATELTVPGGTLEAAAVSAVGVLPTHRRRGHLSRLMGAQLADAADRGEALAVLIAAEYPIYGRYGYGPATEACTVRVDSLQAHVRGTPVGTLDLVDGLTFAEAIQEVYERARRTTPGHISWHPAYWRVQAGVESYPDGHDDDRRAATKVVWRDRVGVVQAAASYTVENRWDQNRPAGRLSTTAATSATPEAGRELLRYLTSVDWITRADLTLRPVDDTTSLHLVDGRAAVLVDRSDHIWARVIDVATALGARRYACADALTIEVTDPMGLSAGRFRLEGGPDGAVCAATTAGADLAAPVGTVGAAYLGGSSWARLAAAGWVDEITPGSVSRASAMFATQRAPWCAHTF